MWQSGLAACGHVGVATRASGVLLMTRRGACVHACSGSGHVVFERGRKRDDRCSILDSSDGSSTQRSIGNSERELVW